MILLLSLAMAGCMARNQINETSKDNMINAEWARKSTEWTNCTGFYVHSYYSKETIRPQQDPEWAPPKGPGIYQVEIRALQCKRVAWGQFERPITAILEIHDADNPPEACWPPSNPKGVTYLRTLASVWVNDTQFGDWLRATYDGLNVYSGPISLNESMQGALRDRTLTWGIDADHQSQLHALDEGGDAPSHAPILDRLYWFNATRVGYMDMDVDAYKHELLVERPAYGTLVPPMIGAEAGKDYQGTGVWLRNGTATGIIQQFKDHQCKEPDL